MTTYFVAAHALIKRDDLFLIIRRSLESDYKPGLWDIPGGTVESGETPAFALIREIREETTLKVVSPRICHIYTNLDQLPIRQTFQIVYTCDFLDGEVVLNPQEHDRFEWISFRQFNDFDLIPFLEETIRECTGVNFP